jgi:hypothetical protein
MVASTLINDRFLATFNIYIYMCQNIFDKIYIIYYRLSYVSEGVLLLKTLILYIYQLKGTIQPIITCNIISTVLP